MRVILILPTLVCGVGINMRGALTMSRTATHLSRFYGDLVAEFTKSEQRIDLLWSQWWYRLMALPAFLLRPLLRVGRWLIRSRLMYFQRALRRWYETGNSPGLVLWVAALESLFPNAHRFSYRVFFHFLVFVEAVWCFAFYSVTWLEGGMYGKIVLITISLAALGTLIASLRNRIADLSGQ